MVFLKNTPKQVDINTLATFDYSPEEYHLQDRIIFFYAANGAADAKMNNNFFENKLKVSCTTRNWNTVNKLVELSRLD